MKTRKTIGEAIKANWKIVAAILAVVVVVYLSGVIYFSGHFSPGTVVNGHKVAGQSESQVKTILEEDLDAHTLVLQERNDKTEQMKAEEIDMEVHPGESVKNALKDQNQFLWFFPFFRNMDIKLHPEVTYDETKLETVVERHKSSVVTQNDGKRTRYE